MSEELIIPGIPMPSGKSRGAGRLALPHWSQLEDRFGDVTEQWSAAITDCGEECVSMVVYAARGLYTTEGQVRQVMGLPADSGTSSAGNICFALSHYGIVQRLLYTRGYEQRRNIRAAIDTGYPVIALGAFVSPAVLHWVCVVDYGGGKIGFNDPWAGTVRYEPWSWWFRFSSDVAIVCESKVARQGS